MAPLMALPKFGSPPCICLSSTVFLQESLWKWHFCNKECATFWHKAYYQSACFPFCPLISFCFLFFFNSHNGQGVGQFGSWGGDSSDWLVNFLWVAQLLSVVQLLLVCAPLCYRHCASLLCTDCRGTSPQFQQEASIWWCDLFQPKDA